MRNLTECYNSIKILTIAVGIKYAERRLITLENTLEFCEVDCKVIANAFEAAVKFSNFCQRQAGQLAICLELACYA